MANVRNIELLSAEEEIRLFTKFKNENCLKSAEKIVVSSLRFVASIVRDLRNYKLDPDDLFQEGVVGLMKATKNFDVSKGIRFVTYAKAWIKSEILIFIEKNISIVRTMTTKTHKKLFYNINKLRTSHNKLSAEDIRHIAKELDVKEDDVREMNVRLSKPDVSLDKKVFADTETYTIADTLVHHNDTSYLTVRGHYEQNKALEEGIALLDGRDKDIFTKRKLLETPKTLQEVANEYGVSPERIRQIESRSLRVVSNHVLTNV